MNLVNSVAPEIIKLPLGGQGPRNFMDLILEFIKFIKLSLGSPGTQVPFGDLMGSRGPLRPLEEPRGPRGPQVDLGGSRSP